MNTKNRIEKIILSIKSCYNCKFDIESILSEKCNNCIKHSNWELKDYFKELI